ncbi:hypothetical protein PVAP13_3KG228186 [Panicum virgatum]|uniref:Uncharacterized protein n=1 Tax=Panicum virgatum TaxID=38727 RepID=A0A8T0V1J0_PANVG|nr:hypothetical protein PVAP13_3KG228186 [Panicum virgatum]
MTAPPHLRSVPRAPSATTRHRGFVLLRGVAITRPAIEGGASHGGRAAGARGRHGRACTPWTCPSRASSAATTAAPPWRKRGRERWEGGTGQERMELMEMRRRKGCAAAHAAPPLLRRPTHAAPPPPRCSMHAALPPPHHATLRGAAPTRAALAMPHRATLPRALLCLCHAVRRCSTGCTTLRPPRSIAPPSRTRHFASAMQSAPLHLATPLAEGRGREEGHRCWWE